MNFFLFLKYIFAILHMDRFVCVCVAVCLLEVYTLILGAVIVPIGQDFLIGDQFVSVVVVAFFSP